jgi:hypothetical protein
LFVFLQFGRKTWFHFCYYEFIVDFLIFLFIVYWSKYLYLLNLVAIYRNLRILNTGEKIVIETISKISLKITILYGTKIVKSLDLDQFLTSLRPEICWHSNNSCVDAFSAWYLIDQNVLIRHRVISHIGKHYYSILVFVQSVLFLEIFNVLKRLIESCSNSGSSWLKIWVNWLSNRIFV